MSIALTRDQVGTNHTERWFIDPTARARSPREDWPVLSRTHVADLRATHGRRRGDTDVETLVSTLYAASAEFASLWDEHEVGVRRADSKRIIHPEVGVVDLLCEVLVSEVNGQMLVVLFARPGSDAREMLDLIRVIGTQDFASSS